MKANASELTNEYQLTHDFQKLTKLLLEVFLCTGEFMGDIIGLTI
jgi:hypothetical protein